MTLSGLRSVALSCVVVFAPSIAVAQEDPRVTFLGELSNRLLGQPQPLKLGDGKGWRGVLLAPSGTPLSPLISAFDPEGYEGVSASLVLQNVNLFDRVLLVENGTGHFGLSTVGEVWEEVLARSRPRQLLLLPEEEEKAPTYRWLFAQPDKVDRARGVTFEREPSMYMKRYREYELLYSMLVIADTRDDGAWRLHPRLSSFGTIEEARRTVAEDWIKFGFKTEIDAAQADFNARMSGEKWREWTEANTVFRSGRLILNADLSVPRSLLFPPPAAWLGMGSWTRVTSRIAGTDKTVTFQLARISIMRPWLKLESLLDGKLEIDFTQQENADFSLSHGDEPSLTQYPKGRMSVFAEELLIVRQIAFSDDSIRDKHLLGGIVDREATNLVGYVVRILPAYPRSSQP